MHDGIRGRMGGREDGRERSDRTKEDEFFSESRTDNSATFTVAPPPIASAPSREKERKSIKTPQVKENFVSLCPISACEAV